MLTNSIKINIISAKGVITVTAYNMIKESFGYDEPILASDIEAMFPERSRPWIDKAIKTMVDENQLKRFSTGVYYVPRKTPFGDSLLNPHKVIEKKYIKNNDETFGYVSGMSLLNSLGLTTQVPNSITIVTNNESSRGRKITVGNLSVYLIKSSAEIRNENCATLQFLEIMKLVDPNAFDKFEINNLERYIDDNNITLAMVSKYCTFFPDYVSKRLLSSKVILKLANRK